MPFVYYGGVNELFRLVHLANPTLPTKLNQNNTYVAKLTSQAEAATATLAGRYGSGVKGLRDVKYHRLDLAKLTKNLTLQVKVNEPKAVLDALLEIFESTGLAFAHSDLVPVSLPANQTLPYRTTLKAASTSLVYYGQCEVEFVYGPVTLVNLVQSRELALTLEGVPGSSAHQRAEWETFGADYTSIADKLLAVTLGTLDWAVEGNATHQVALALAYDLNSIDGLPWATGATDLWTLKGAVVRYNGRTNAYDDAWYSSLNIRRPNTRFDRVLVIDFPHDNSTAGLYGSTAFIHYNTHLNEV